MKSNKVMTKRWEQLADVHAKRSVDIIKAMNAHTIESGELIVNIITGALAKEKRNDTD